MFHIHADALHAFLYPHHFEILPLSPIAILQVRLEFMIASGQAAFACSLVPMRLSSPFQSCYMTRKIHNEVKDTP